MVLYGRRKNGIVNMEDGAVVSMISIDATASFCNIRPSRIPSLHFVFIVVLQAYERGDSMAKQSSNIAHIISAF